MSPRLPLVWGLGALLLVLVGASQWPLRRGGVSAQDAGPREPPVLPLQVQVTTTVAPAAPEQAQALWWQALDGFRSARSDAEAVALTAPRLREIWMKWPETELAVRARWFAIDTLGRYRATGLEDLRELVESALAAPGLYFQDEFQLSMQTAAAELVRRLEDEGRAAEAWRLCLRLRWGVPRIDRIAPACRTLIARHREMGLAPQAVLALLPRSLAVLRPAPEPLGEAGAAALWRYLAQPYDPELLMRAYLVLWRAKLRGECEPLAAELLGLDPGASWRLETR